MLVVAAPLAPLMTRFSKLPPAALATVTLKLSAPSASTSCSVAMLKLALLEPAGIVTVATPVKSAPFAAVPLYVRLTVTAVCAALVSETTYAAVAPSATTASPVIETVVASIVSVMVVVAALALTFSASKLPPVALVIVREMLPASTYTSSVGARTDTEPVLLPAAMVIVSPVDNVTVTGVCAALVNVAV